MSAIASVKVVCFFLYGFLFFLFFKKYFIILFVFPSLCKFDQYPVLVFGGVEFSNCTL